MKIEEIKKNFDKFNIPQERIPIYEDDPNKFIGRYKKCSIKTYGTITYTNSSIFNNKA